MHFGTLEMTTEGIDEPVSALKEAREAREGSVARFRTLDCGESMRIGSGGVRMPTARIVPIAPGPGISKAQGVP